MLHVLPPYHWGIPFVAVTAVATFPLPSLYPPTFCFAASSATISLRSSFFSCDCCYHTPSLTPPTFCFAACSATISLRSSFSSCDCCSFIVWSYFACMAAVSRSNSSGFSVTSTPSVLLPPGAATYVMGTCYIISDIWLQSHCNNFNKVWKIVLFSWKVKFKVKNLITLAIF